ncbi:hypothetical protein [Halopiger goleimassiliensis]|uniref:hypothetical protein n=1 Tax=Halopiger goleimassiliensis TaxID=1293048 RepID=UPI000677D40F|nr:hypothetical protein [Halopiger goleimassiliensis]
MGADVRDADATDGTPGLESAGFVQVVTRADGDALAASGIIARALAERETPFQVTVGRTVAERTERVEAADAGTDDLTLSIGATDGDAPRLDDPDRPATTAAVEVARDLGASPDPVLALAGLVAAGVEPGAGDTEWLLETARDRDLVDRRPGVAVSTADPVDDLAHSTRVRAPWSGDPAATSEALAEIDVEGTEPDLESEDHRAIGSLVALDAVGAPDATEHAAEAIGRALKPYATPSGPFATVGGYADVLEATARTEPGTGAALAMGHDARDPALDAWRSYGRRAHEAIEGASTGRYDGLYVVDVDDGPVTAVGRLVAAYRSPEPTVLVTGDGEAALVAREGPVEGATVERIARELESATDAVAYDVGPQRGYLQYAPSTEASTVVTTVREVR